MGDPEDDNSEIEDGAYAFGYSIAPYGSHPEGRA
jgi:hypothetical protein